MIKKTALLIVAMLFLAPARANAAISNWEKSASFVPTSNSDLASATFEQSLKNFKAVGGNSVDYVITLYQANEQATSMHAGDNTPSDASLASAINYAHNLGMKVSLTLHVDLENGDWRAYINPGDRATWFANYQSFLLHYADIAQTNKVEEYVIGAELTSMTNPQINPTNTDNWNKLISAVRQHFSGKLTYSAQRQSGYYDEWNTIGFWNNLDALGLSAYYPLAQNVNNPSVSDYINSWNSVNNNYITPIYNQYKKPVLFTELGYRSENGTHNHPFDYGTNGGVSQQEQANLYQALFQYWNGQGSMAGLHIWDWKTNPSAGGINDSGYTPQNKLAQATIQTWYGGSGTTTSPTPTPTTPTPTPTTGPTGPQAYIFKSGDNPTSPAINQNSTLTTTVATAQPIGNAVVDIEIYNSSNTRIEQHFYENQNLSSSPSSYSFVWNTGSAGNYRVTVGLFSAGWGSMYIWNNDVATIVAGSQPVTPTPTTPPQTTPTPTTQPGSPTPSPTTGPQPTTQPGNYSLSIWWPTNGATISGTQPFKAIINGQPVDNYQMFWQVDGGGLNGMGNNSNGGDHKEADVDVSPWNWSGNGPYTVNFVAKDNNGNMLTQSAIKINVAH